MTAKNSGFQAGEQPGEYITQGPVSAETGYSRHTCKNRT